MISHLRPEMFCGVFLVLGLVFFEGGSKGPTRPRAREIGIEVGVLKPGRLNAITDIEGVRIGHVTLISGESVRTGVTAILPHPGNIFQEKVPASIYVANGFGKLVGYTQVEELGQIETPILLTNTLSVPVASDAIIDHILSLPGNEKVMSVNPIVGETNDGWLNDIRGRHVKSSDAIDAIKRARSGPVEEGSVGAGTGIRCFGFKGGIGTSSRVLPKALGGYTLGVLVQTNYGGILQINGAPVGRELGEYYLKEHVSSHSATDPLNARSPKASQIDGSCMIVVATDAPLGSRHLKRLARRAMLGLAKTGSSSASGSGDYVIAFSTSRDVRIHQNEVVRRLSVLSDDAISPLFQAVVEATEEAVYNSLLKATTMTGRDGHTVEAIPVDKVLEICKKYNVLNLTSRFKH